MQPRRYLCTSLNPRKPLFKNSLEWVKAGCPPPNGVAEASKAPEVNPLEVVDFVLNPIRTMLRGIFVNGGEPTHIPALFLAVAAAVTVIKLNHFQNEYEPKPPVEEEAQIEPGSSRYGGTYEAKAIEKEPEFDNTKFGGVYQLKTKKSASDDDDDE